MGKKLKINCATCDVRNLREEVLQAYDSVSINCTSILATPESKALMSRYSVQMNCADVLVVGSEVKVKTINGKAQIKASDAAGEPFYYVVNGMLEIEPGTEKFMEKCVGLKVNGMVLYPESMAGHLGMMDVNGKSVSYPDEAIVLKNNAVVDRAFALRAKNRLYWSAKRMILVDAKLDGAVLEQKGARFAAAEAIIAESLVESLIGLIDERTQIVIVPDGTAVIMDDITLDDTCLERYGRKMYVAGDVSVEENCAGAVKELEYLYVEGDMEVAANVKKAVLEKTEFIDGELKVYYGTVLRNMSQVNVTAKLLELENDGVSIVDCAVVKLNADVSGEMIRKMLRLQDCDVVECSGAQYASVMAVSENVGVIQTDMREEPEEDRDVVKINTANYVM